MSPHNSNLTAAQVIRLLDLKPLPGEGGFFKETYRKTISKSGAQITTDSTAIYYLVTADAFSALHRLKYDEIFHYYQGGPVRMLLIHSDGSHEVVKLGSDLSNGEKPQVVIPAGTWQGSKLANPEGWALLGTTMAPAFEFADLEIGNRESLIESYPHLTELISQYTR